MPSKSRQAEVPKGNGKKVFISIVLIAASVYYAYGKFSSITTPSAAINNGVSSEQGEMPQRADMEKTFQVSAKAAGLSADQQAKIQSAMEDARSKAENGDFGAIRDAMRVANDTMTTDQQTKFREKMREEREKANAPARAARAKREERVKAALGEEQYKRLEEKRAERRRNWGGGQGGRGGNRGGDRGGNRGGNQGNTPPGAPRT